MLYLYNLLSHTYPMWKRIFHVSTSVSEVSELPSNMDQHEEDCGLSVENRRQKSGRFWNHLTA
jgi:hypothetical protein